jgi:hypothetical protein
MVAEFVYRREWERLWVPVPVREQEQGRERERDLDDWVEGLPGGTWLRTWLSTWRWNRSTRWQEPQDMVGLQQWRSRMERWREQQRNQEKISRLSTQRQMAKISSVGPLKLFYKKVGALPETITISMRTAVSSMQHSRISQIITCFSHRP